MEKLRLVIFDTRSAGRLGYEDMRAENTIPHCVLFHLKSIRLLIVLSQVVTSLSKRGLEDLAFLISSSNSSPQTSTS